MSAEVLRQAATLMRQECLAVRRPYGRDEKFKSAVADWLDTAGADIWAHGPLCECTTGCDACDDNLWEPHARDALTVARAYLGSES